MLCAFAIPLLLFQTIIYPRISTAFIASETTVAQNNLKVISDNLSARIRSIHQYRSIFYSNPGVVSYNLTEDTPLNRRLICSTLSSSLRAADYNRVYFYNPDLGRLYTSENTYQQSWINNASSQNLLYIDAFPGEALFEKLADCDKLEIESAKICLSGIQHDSTMLYIPVQGGFGTLLFILDTDALLQSPKEKLFTRYLIDSEGRVLASSAQHMPIADQQEIADSVIAKLGSRDNCVIIVQGEPYVAVLEPVGAYGLRLFDLIPQSSIYAHLSNIKDWYTQLLLIFIVLGTGIVILLTNLLYSPIRKARSHASRLVSAPLDPNADDLKAITFALDHINERYGQMDRHMQMLANTSQQYFLFRYIYDESTSGQDMAEISDLYNIDMRKNVVVVSFSSIYPIESDIVQAFFGTLQSLFESDPSAASCYAIPGINYVSFHILLFFNSDNELTPYLHLFDTLPEGIKAGIGSHQNHNAPYRSRSFSVAALEVAMLSNTLSFAYSDDIPIQPADVMHTFSDSLLVLEREILHGNAEQTQETFRKIMSLMFEQTSRVYILQNMYLNAHNMFVRTINTLRKEHNLSIAPMQYLITTFDIPRNVPDMQSELERLIQIVLDVFKKSALTKDDDGASRIHEILHYIDDNYPDTEISLLSVSELFGFSYSNFSHYFHSRTGSTFSNYLNNVRIEHSKDLLVSRKLTIEQIAAAVGYTNAGTFNRIFKKVTGVSPGAFRKSNAE